MSQMGITPGDELRSTLFSEGTSVLRSELELTALSQHYEYGSAMIDVTRNPEVAVWFASRQWNDGRVFGTTSKEPTGYIYRFDEEAISRMLNDRVLWGSGRAPFLPHIGLFGIAAIDQLPSAIGKRPSAQSGGGVFGMELSCVYFLLDAYRALQVFSFPHGSVTGDETGLGIEALRPDTDDPGVNTFPQSMRSDTRPLTDIEISTFLRDTGTSESDVSDVLRTRRMGAS